MKGEPSDDHRDLQRFVATRDEPSFRKLLDRHSAMVHGVALRRLQSHAMAQDVTQQVFIMLARKASAIAPDQLAGWLHRCAFQSREKGSPPA
ncbi:RNA polymerase sigma factor [Luteolibacter sp. Populi]|uniref:RNA polymerase sigma factor n=1 Tax=Luteolibacter sp. Populi TaxID=3230487 RepID=UPI003465D7AA